LPVVAKAVPLTAWPLLLEVRPYTPIAVPLAALLEPMTPVPEPDTLRKNPPAGPPVVELANPETPTPLGLLAPPYAPIVVPVVAELLPNTAGLVVLELSTSNCAAGVLVLMPTFPLTWAILELPNVFVPVQIGIAPFVPDPVTWAYAVDIQRTVTANHRLFAFIFFTFLGLKSERI